MATLQLGSDEIDRSRQLAKASHDQFQRARGHCHNRLRTHFVGKLDGIGALWGLETVGLKCETAFEDANRLSDCNIIVKGTMRVEVKTWSSSCWAELGECIAVRQSEVLKRKCGIVP